MKAWINNGRGLGSGNTIVTNEYKSIETMERYAIMPFLNQYGYCRVDIHYNWDTRYGKANKTLIYEDMGSYVYKRELKIGELR